MGMRATQNCLAAPPPPIPPLTIAPSHPPFPPNTFQHATSGETKKCRSVAPTLYWAVPPLFPLSLSSLLLPPIPSHTPTTTRLVSLQVAETLGALRKLPPGTPRRQHHCAIRVHDVGVHPLQSKRAPTDEYGVPLPTRARGEDHSP